MTQNQPPEIIAQIADTFYKRLLKIEMVLAPIVVIGLILKFLNVSGGGSILVVALLTLSNIYFFIGFRKVDPASTNYDRFVNKLMFFSYSIALVGILFTLNLWPIGLTLFYLGLLSVATSFVFLFVLHKILKRLTKTNAADFIRTIVIFILLVVTLLSPQYIEALELEESPDTTEVVD